MDQEQLQLVLGIKIRTKRQKLGFSLKELADRTDLSPSYLNEIEKGKKYPKPEKLLRLAQALDMPFEKMVSPKLDRGLHPLAALLDSPAIQKFPFHVFGITLQDVVHLLSQTPKEANALVRALVSITRDYHLGIERFFHAALRSFQALNENYFPDLEEAADRCRVQIRAMGPELESLVQLLGDVTGAAIHPLPQQLKGVRSVFKSKPAALFIDSDLKARQKAFLVAREVGYALLGLKERAWSSPPLEVSTFDQVLNDFKASYFAGAVLLPRSEVLPALKDFFRKSTWQPDAFQNLLRQFDATPELFFYRMSQLLPHEMGLVRSHFLRFRHDRTSGSVTLTKELNMSDLDMPAGLGLQEHFCRRWLSLRVFEGLQRGSSQVGVQRSRFFSSSGTYLCLAVGQNDGGDHDSSVTLGFLLEKGARSVIGFADDPNIPESILGGTCERCPLTREECIERQAPPRLYEKALAAKEKRMALNELLGESGP